MKQVAILLLLALFLNGCGSGSSDVQSAVGGTWESQMLGGSSGASGFSFITEFNVTGAGGSLTIDTFQFLTAGPCFPIDGGTINGNMILTVNPDTFAVTGPFVMTVVSGINTLTLNGTVTGTENGTTGTELIDGMITGTWTLTGSSGCTDPTGGSFTMTQSASTTSQNQSLR